MSNTRLSVLGRETAIKHCKKKHNYETAIISISTPNVDYDESPFIDNENNVSEILELSFCDADFPGEKDVYGRLTTDFDLMTDEDADKVVEFMERHKDKFIIVHCDAGISRSAGVAAAILKYYNGDDSPIFDSRWYNPNRWCYRKVLEAFERKFSNYD